MSVIRPSRTLVRARSAILSHLPVPDCPKLYAPEGLPPNPQGDDDPAGYRFTAPGSAAPFGSGYVIFKTTPGVTVLKP